MSPAVMYEPPVTVTQLPTPSSPAKLSREEVQRIVREPNGASALIVLLRDDKVDADTVIDAITRQQNEPSSRIKRWLIAVVDAVLPS